MAGLCTDYSTSTRTLKLTAIYLHTSSFSRPEITEPPRSLTMKLSNISIALALAATGLTMPSGEPFALCMVFAV